MSDSPIGKVGNRRELFDFLSVVPTCRYVVSACSSTLLVVLLVATVVLVVSYSLRLGEA